jgi:hypothetical protein
MNCSPLGLRSSIVVSIAGVRAELGQEAVEEACEAIILLHEQNNQSARYWSCPTCDQKFNSGREYLAHIELAHEELAVQVGEVQGGDSLRADCWVCVPYQTAFGVNPKRR